MKAFILAGGEGRRLRLLLGDLPKCLAPVQGRPFIERQIELLKEQGVGEFVLCVGVGAEAIEKTLGDGRRLGIAIEYSHEESPLGTGGALKNASSRATDTFLCVNGDTLVEFSLQDMEANHKNKGATASIVCRRVEDSTGKGTVVTADGGEIVRFREKAVGSASALINCGYYLMERQVLEHIPPRRAASLERETFPGLLESGCTLVAFVTQGAFVDIGTPGDYLRLRDRGWRQ